MANKTTSGNYFEDFSLGQQIVHATPRTITPGDASVYTAMYGTRWAVQSANTFAQNIGLPESPIDDFLVFNIVFGKTVPDVSLNAIANLGYAAGKFGVPVYAGDTVSTVSEVIGLKENSNRRTGTVYVRSVGSNQHGETVLDYVRWVMVPKRKPEAQVADPVVPDLPRSVAATDLIVPKGLKLSGYDMHASGSSDYWEDYSVNEQINHVDGVTVEESDHMTATRLYQNTAKVHFNQHAEKDGRFGRRIVYGGHIISIARAASFNGLGNAFKVVAINGGRHVAPCFAGDTIYAWTQVLDKIELPSHPELGALRLRTVAAKDHACDDYPYKNSDRSDHRAVVLDFDYAVLVPRRPS